MFTIVISLSHRDHTYVYVGEENRTENLWTGRTTVNEVHEFTAHAERTTTGGQSTGPAIAVPTNRNIVDNLGNLQKNYSGGQVGELFLR